MNEIAQNKNTPRDTFLHLLAVVMLYVGIFSFIMLLFAYISYVFPDALEYEYSYRGGAFDAARQSMAALFIVWPVYIFLMYMIQKDVRALPEKKEFGIRKWLVYLTLFAASIAIIVTLITLIHRFLGGELTVRFALKVLTVLGTAAAVFGFYFWDMRQKHASASNMRKIAAIASSLAVFAVVASGFFIIGTPGEQRKVRFDDRRVQDLQFIQGQIVYIYWQQKGVLPSKLDDLRDDISGFVPPRDPETQQAYEYSAVGELSFELCAVFQTENTSNNSASKDRYAQPAPVGFRGVSDNWAHGIGRVCFDRTIDPELYPLRDKQIEPAVP